MENTLHLLTIPLKNSDCSMLDHVNGKFWNITVDIKHFSLQQTGEKLGNRTKVHITI